MARLRKVDYNSRSGRGSQRHRSVYDLVCANGTKIGRGGYTHFRDPKRGYGFTATCHAAETEVWGFETSTAAREALRAFADLCPCVKDKD